MVRKRCFETLEDRRLLSGIAGSATPAPASLVGDMAKAQPVSAEASAAGTSSSATPTTAESPNEYAASSGATASNATAEYAARNSSIDYPNGYDSNSRLTPYYSPAQTAAIQSLAAALGEQPQTARVMTPSEALALVGAVASASTFAAGGAPATGATRWNPSDLVVRSESSRPLAISVPSTPGPVEGTQELAAPVALLAPDGDATPGTADEAAIAQLLQRAADAASAAAPQVAKLLTGPAGINLALVERGVDELFERLDRLGGELAESAGPRQFAHLLMAAAGAAAAWEYARARYREGEARQTADWRAPRELQLRRRWLVRRRGRP